jgi:hypothetical protein
MGKPQQFCIVETTDSKGIIEVSAVPENWVQKNFLAWPPNNKKLSSLIQSKTNPENSWRREKCIVLKTGIGKFDFGTNSTI